MTDCILYCNVCTNKKWNSQTGIICTKTNQKPNFKNSCENYVYSESNYKELIESKRKFYEKILSRDIINGGNSLKVNPNKFKENHEFSSIHRTPEKIDILYPFPIKLFYNKPIVQLDNVGIKWYKINLNFESIKNRSFIKKQELKWSEILYTSFQVERNNKGKDNEQRIERLVIDSISPKSSMEIPIHFDKRKSEIGHYIELFKRKNNVG